MVLRLRERTPEETTAIDRRAQSRTAPARAVERARIIWHDNKVRDCNRAFVLSGTGALTLTIAGVQPRLQHRTDVLMYGNRASNCGVDLFIDRPWSGRIFDHVNDNCLVTEQISAAAVAVAGALYADQKWAVDRAA